MLLASPGLRPITVLGEMQRRHAGFSDVLRRTLERRIRLWQALLAIDGSPLLQLWLEDSPNATIPDFNRARARLVQFQRILVIKAWIAAKPIDGPIPADGLLAESES